MGHTSGTDLLDRPVDMRDITPEPTRRVRVLIEHENPVVLTAQAAALVAAGFDVDVCGGPRRGEGGICPLMATGTCAKAERADVIVDQLTLGHIGVYAALRQYRPECPVALALSDNERDEYPLLAGFTHTIPRNLRGRRLVDAVRELADPHDAA